MINSQLTDETAGENEKYGNGLAIIALILSLIAYAFVPLLIRWSQVEISPESIMFNRFWIAGLMLFCGQGLQKVKQILTNQQPAENVIICKLKFHRSPETPALTPN
jgi:hypothetical protein